jgi:hypothetical protein
MDSANKQTAIVSEVTQGATPATPGFSVMRDTRVSGAPQRADVRSPERRSDRMAYSMTRGLVSFPKTIELAWSRDAGTDVLWEAALCGVWASNVLKNGSAQRSFTVEEKYEGGVTDAYRRLAGCVVDQVDISLQNGEPGQLNFAIRALAEATATTPIVSSTYAAPTPGLDPVTPADILVNSLFGITAPKVVSLSMRIENNMREQYAWGSPSPFATGLGLFNVSGSVQLYFSQLSDYSAFVNRQSGQLLDITLGSVTNSKDRISCGACDVWNPDVNDPGATGDHLVTLNFLAKYFATDTAAIKFTRNAP